MMPIINAKNLEKSFENIIAIKKIDFSIFSGKITGVVGPDGAGNLGTEGRSGSTEGGQGPGAPRSGAL